MPTARQPLILAIWPTIEPTEPAAAGHHRVGLDRCAIGRAMHPGAVGGIERNIMHAKQRFAVLWFRNGRACDSEMLGAELAGRLLHQQHLSIDTRAHGTPPSVIIW